jgi:hypothetical protein
LKKAYIAKKGSNSLKDKSIEIKLNGGLYDGVDLSVKSTAEILLVLLGKLYLHRTS